MDDVQRKSLGRRLQYERESRHWTQAELAKKIKGSVPSINRWEHDRSKPRPDVYERLSEVFGKLPEHWGADRPVLWNIPFLRNQYFTGREQTLQQLYRALTDDSAAPSSMTYALSGLGGIGKTQTAIEYVYRYANEYEAVLWVQADAQEILTSEFASLAYTLNLREKDESDQFRMIAAVKRWLQDHHSWLLILDNADDLEMVTDFLPRRRNGAILLTTRAQSLGPYIKRVGLEKMSCEEGVDFLLHRVIVNPDKEDEEELAKRFSPQDRQAAQQLWTIMDGLPLALDQAGAYIEAKQSNFSDYLRLYRDHRTALLHQRGTRIPEHPDAVTMTWSLSFQRVQQKNPLAAELLRFCAFLFPDAIPEELLTQGVAHVVPTLAELASSNLALEEAIDTLRSYSLIHREPKKHLLSIHRLVQVVLQDALTEQERQLWTTRAVQAVNAVFPRAAPDTRLLCEKLLPHALLAAHYIEQDTIYSAEAGHLLFETAFHLHTYGRYAEAEVFYARALAIREQMLGPLHLVVGEALSGLGSIYIYQGKYTEADPLFVRALAIREQQLGPQHPAVAEVVNSIAFLYINQGKYSDKDKYARAEPLFLRAIHIYEQAEHPDLPVPINNLAKLYFEHGRFEEAEPLYLRALQLFEQYLGPEHPRTAMPLNNLANIYSMQGRYSEGEPLFQRALHIWEQQLGPEHPLVAVAVGNLAELAWLQGNYRQAEPLFKRMVLIYERTLGPDHPETAEALYDVGRFQEAQGNYTEARQYFMRSLAVREQMLGMHHAQTVQTRTSLIDLLNKLGQHEEAAQYQVVQPEQGTNETPRNGDDT